MWTIFKVCITFVTTLLLLFMFWFFWPRGMWDLNPLTKELTLPPTGRRSPNYWTTGNAPNLA